MTIKNMEVEVMLSGHPHLFVLDVESVLEAHQLRGTEAQCTVCGHIGTISMVGTPGRKPREQRPNSPNQKSLFKE
jgi:hypothetical protein